MICPNCNSLIDNNAVVCPECGAPTTQNSNNNFNNYFAQDENFNSGYQNPQYSQQNNFNPPFPNGNQGYSQDYNQYPPNNYQYPYNAQPVDPGEGSATTSQICGVLSLFLGPILAIISLIFASKYKKNGNGQNAGKVKAGKICSWISIIVTLLSIAFLFLSVFTIIASNAKLLDDIGYQTNDDNSSVIEDWSDSYFDNSNEPISEGEFGSSSEYNGIYKIQGASSASVGDKIIQLDLYLDGIDNENAGTLNMANSSMEKYVVDFKKFVYIKLTFDENKISDWSLIDITTSKDLGKPTKEELVTLFKPEESYEVFSAGDMPEEILLSKYEPGKTYVFNIVPEDDGYYDSPIIINDTEFPVISVMAKRTANDEYDDFFEKLCVTEDFDLSRLNLPSGDSDKLYLAITESSADYLLANEDCMYLSECEVGKEIAFDFEDYIYNDTEKTYTLSCENKEYTLTPGEFAECSWINDVMIANAE